MISKVAEGVGSAMSFILKMILLSVLLGIALTAVAKAPEWLPYIAVVFMAVVFIQLENISGNLRIIAQNSHLTAVALEMLTKMQDTK